MKVEKIITASARDYVESIGKKLIDYDLVGVDSMTTFGGIESLLEEIPKGTEAVTDLKVNTYFFSINQFFGTALVPKKN